VPNELYQQPVEQVAPEPAPIVDAPQVVEAPVVQEPQPIVAPEPVVETPAPQTAPVAEPVISDEEVARLEAELGIQEPTPEPEVIKPGMDPSEVPTDIKLKFGVPEFPSVDEEPPAYQAPPPAAEPIPEAPQPQVDMPSPEPLQPQPVLEPQPEIAPISEAAPTPEVQPVVSAPPAQSVCPGCGKKTKPKWKTCPYCEQDLAGAKVAEPAVETPAPAVVAPVEPVAEPVVSQAAPIDTVPAVTDVPAAPPTCTTCGQPGTWIEDYKRFYCYTCSQYL
jgi:hypothetical protein